MPRVGAISRPAAVDPAREKPRLRPLAAFGHFRRLMDNTETRPKSSASSPPAVARRGQGGRGFCRATGPRPGAGRTLAARVLDDHAALRAMGPGSLGWAYCDFMQAEGLTAQGLVDEAERFLADRPRYNDRFQWYMNRLRDVHDLLHVLTGYGRDALGEACVLAFTYPQQPAPGICSSPGWRPCR
jgi:ubiquinone biosynthesis protein COQ4